MTLLQFECRDMDGTFMFVRVMDTFEHYYTKETMRRVRIDYVVNGKACVESFVLDEAGFNDLIALKVVDND